MSSANTCIIYEIFLFALSIGFTSSQVEEGSPCFEWRLNVIGRCTVVDNCNSARRDLLNNTVPTLCSFTNNSVQVCCRDGTPAEKTDLPRFIDKSVNSYWLAVRFYMYYRKNYDHIRVSERKCLDMLQEVNKKAKELLDETDDINLKGGIAYCAGIGFIIGGKPAYPNQFPHMAAIGWTTPEGEYKYNCGGTLISPRFVMTAAHCTYDPNAVNHEPDVVYLGDHNISPAYKDARSMNVGIKTIYKHPDYRSPLRYNDIALLELEKTLEFNINIRPACLLNREDFLKNTSETATAIGWGVTDTGKKADVLQWVSLSILDNEPCDYLLASFRNRNWWGFAPSQLCAGELSGGKDTCQGDSGGPLLVVDSSCMYHVMGVTSFGHKCGRRNRPAIYTRVSSYLDWIESIVWPGE